MYNHFYFTALYLFYRRFYNVLSSPSLRGRRAFKNVGPSIVVVMMMMMMMTRITLTRNPAVADKPRDAFTGQSRSLNMVPFHMLGIVSYYSNFVRKTHQ